MKPKHVAIVGATGAVGNVMREILESRNFPVASIKLLASERSVGKTYKFRGENVAVQTLTPDSFKGIEVALFSAGADRSKVFAPEAVKRGAVVVDNTSYFRMQPDVPLVVPEVNPEAIKKHKGIIANPNCSTIGLVMALYPLHKAAKIKRAVISTYQSVSGAGAKAIYELEEQAKAYAAGKPIEVKKFQYQIAFNLIPHIDQFLPDGYTKEEVKMMQETRKIMGDDSIRVTATCVRVPVFYAHSESVAIETEKPLFPEKARELLSKMPGVKVQDEPEKNIYPMPLFAGGKDDTFVGRIRKDESVENGLTFWLVSDNLRKGAALNAVQIAEHL
ncbi:MAG: aspartate-semialdehyde dehydrogenase [Candidatus Omnitrophica bacterium]|nr:aspartate-semialdehyde dehydrogenase [Candidatus Omnitrophota bacterium]